MIDFKNKTLEEIDKIRGDYKNYSGLIFNDETLYNPLERIPKELEEKPHLYYSWLLSNTEYIHFFCSEFLNVHLLPFQCVIIKELWERKFPMLIATRGGSKSFCLAVYCIVRAMLLPGRKIVVAGASFRQSKLIYEYCCQIWNNAPLLRDSICSYSGHQGPKGGNDSVYMYLGESKVTFIPVGSGETIRGLRANDVICVSKDTLVQTNKGLIQIKDYLDGNSYLLMNQDNNFEKPSCIIVTDETDVYEIETRCGYSFKCSNVHRVLTTKGWKTAIDLTNDDYLEIDSNNYFPEIYQKYNETVINEDNGWFLGLCISEGDLNNRNTISISNTDKNLIDLIQSRLKDISFKEYYKKAYKDSRGWDCKESWTVKTGDTAFREDLYKLGVDYCIAINKNVPKCILQSPRSVVIQFLAGLFEGDGSCFAYDDKKRLRISYYSASKKLCQSVQILLLKFNIYSSLIKRSSKISKRDQWSLNINGYNSILLYKLIGEFIVKWNINISDFEECKIDKKPHIRKNGKRFVVSTNRNNKNIHIGSFDTEEECIIAFNSFWTKQRNSFKVRSVTRLPEKEVLYDFHMPETHSFIGNGFIQHNCDEFKSLNLEIFENVIAGFASVESSPQEKVASRLEQDFNEIAGIEDVTKKDSLNISNQIVISGTAYYHFNHFAQYWEKWHKIISSGGNPNKLSEIFPDGIEDGFDWKDYSIIRLPYQILPKSYMDVGNIARSKATLNSGLFSMEFSAIFSKDSDGFFKATLIESCVASEHNEIEKKDGLINFFPRLSGDHDKRYYMGVDTASQVDNFAIVIIEAHRDHRRIVYCWTTNTKEFKQGRKSGIIAETDFFRYCSGKIRSLMSKFQIEKIAIDSQGGGRTIYETLHDKASLKPGEQMIWEAIEPGKIKETDSEEGLHIIEMVNFRKQEYTLNANHGLKKDFEDKVCLFPEYNPAILASYANLEGKFAQEMEDCIENIEELKRELTLIVVTSTATGNERFDTPENKTSGVSETSRNKKDRYSALIMANASARKDYHNENDYSARSIEQIANNSLERKDAAYIGPAWITEKLNSLY